MQNGGRETSHGRVWPGSWWGGFRPAASSRSGRGVRSALCTRLRRTAAAGRRILRRFAGDDVPTLAASIAYAAVVSVFPLLIGLIAVLGRFIEQAHLQHDLLAMLAHYLPPSALRTVRDTLAAVVPAAGTAGALALAALLWSGSALVAAVRHGINRTLRVRAEGPFWKRKAVDLVMVVLIGGFLAVSLLGSAAEAGLRALPGVAGIVNAPVMGTVAAAASWLFAWLAFLAAYALLPSVRVSRRSVLYASLLGVLLFETVRYVFFWYLRTLAHYPAIYGPLVGVVVFMIWVYLLAVVLLIGAETMALLEQRRPEPPGPPPVPGPPAPGPPTPPEPPRPPAPL
jgi:membrane protein